MKGSLFYIQCEPYVSFMDGEKAYTRKVLKNNKAEKTATIRFKNKIASVNY